VKNVHLRRGVAACFPDAVTVRGTKHLGELSAVVRDGGRAVMLFLVQREDCRYFEPARDIDPVYAEALDSAVASGVEVYCYGCRLTLESIRLDQPMPLRIAGRPIE
jgi:sugar fermentation stimulation protein A